jgi:hypothetical protein
MATKGYEGKERKTEPVTKIEVSLVSIPFMKKSHTGREE